MSEEQLQLRDFPGYANKSNPIHRAAARGDTAFLRTLKDTLDLNRIKMRDALGATPMHVAAREGHRECLQWLLENTSLSVRDKASEGETPLHVAAARGHVSVLQLLVRHAAPDSSEERARVLLAPDNNQLTALHLAALKGHQAVVNWIVMEYKSYLSPLMETGRVTPAHLAASAGHLEILRTLLSSANRFNGWAEARDTEGTPVAYFAAQEGRLGCVRFLLEELSADPKSLSADGMSALHAAAQAGHDVIIRYYVERLGSDVIHWTTKDKGIPLHFAASLGHSSTVSLLLGYDDTGTTHSLPDDKLVTPLHEALLLGRVECARILIEAGADVRAEDSQGRSPVSIVSQDTFHPCHHVVMHAIKDSISEHIDEEPVTHRIPSARSGLQESQTEVPISPESAVQERNESFISNESKVLSSHSSETTPLPSTASEDPTPVPPVPSEQEETQTHRKSLAELSYSLSALLDDSSSPVPIDKFLAGMDRRTARRQLRWLARSVPSPPDPCPPLPPAATLPEEPSPSEPKPPVAEPPRRQVSSFVLEKMTLLGAAPRAPGSLAELRPVPEERELPVVPGEQTDIPGVRVGRDLPADLPVSEELRFFYGQESEASFRSDSESTLLSADPPAVAATAEDTVEESSHSTAGSEEAPVQTETDESDLSLPEEPADPTADFVEAGPFLGPPTLEALGPTLQSGERPKKGRFSGLRLIGRLLGRREKEEGSGDGVAAFETIMHRNFLIQEQIRSAPYPHLPLDLLGPVATSTAARLPGLAPAWQPEEVLAEEQSSGSPAPPTSSTDSVPDTTNRLIRPSAGQSQTRPISTTIAIETAVPHVLSGPPPSSFTARPQTEPTPSPRAAAPVHDPETLLEGYRVSSRIAGLTQSLLGSAAPVAHPYSQEMVYSRVTADRPVIPADRPVIPADRPLVPADRPLVPADRPVITAVILGPAEPVRESTLPKPESEAALKIAQSRGATSSYDVPSWEEAREYLRRVTARQRERPPEEEEPAVPAVTEEIDSPDPRQEQPDSSPKQEPEIKPVPELCPIPRSPALPDLSAAASEPLQDRDTTPARRKLTPGPSRPSAGPGVSGLRERFSQDGPARPQNLRISALKRETLNSPPKPAQTFPTRTEKVPGPVRPVKSSKGVGKLPALREEAPDASQLLRDMFLDRGGRTENNRDATAPVALRESVAPVEAGEGGGSLRTEVQELSVSGQVRDRLRLFS